MSFIIKAIEQTKGALDFLCESKLLPDDLTLYKSTQFKNLGLHKGLILNPNVLIYCLNFYFLRFTFQTVNSSPI